jgi:hypothetical protein
LWCNFCSLANLLFLLFGHDLFCILNFVPMSSFFVPPSIFLFPLQFLLVPRTLNFCSFFVVIICSMD